MSVFAFKPLKFFAVFEYQIRKIDLQFIAYGRLDGLTEINGC